MNINRQIADAQTSQALLNYLGATLAGQFALYNAQMQLDLPTADESAVGDCREALDLVYRWRTDFYKGSPFISSTWSEPESFEAIKAVDLLTKLKEETFRAGGELAQIFATRLTSTSSEATRAVLAAFFRYAYSRDYFIRGQVAYATLFGQLPLLEKASKLKADASKDISFAGEALARVKSDAEPNPNITNIIVYRALNIPGIFRTNAHDINQLLAQFRGGLSWNSLEFSPQEQSLWNAYQIDPVLAGYWRAYAFSPEESALWIEKGLANATIAFDWKKHGFAPEDAEPWGKAGFPPLAAQTWRTAGFTLEQSIKHVQNGVLDPAQL